MPQYKRRFSREPPTWTSMESMQLAFYRWDPVAFVEIELGEKPSVEQAALLRAAADLDNLDFILCAGRGGGKTMVISWIVAWSIACLIDHFGVYNITILGGSGEQSRIVYKYMKSYIYKTKFLHKRLVADPTRNETQFHGGSVRALTASERSVRGPHPEMLIIDEVCEADDEIVESAFPMVGGSKHGRTMMMSTPHKFWGVFQEYWDNAKDYGYLQFGPWSLEKCHWITARFLEKAKIRYSPDKYRVEVEGKFPKTGMKVFNSDWVDSCIAAEPFGMDNRFSCDIGVDWGQVHPAVMTPVQLFDGVVRAPGPGHIYEMMEYPEVNKKIVEFAIENRGEEIWCDASHMGEIERLQRKGLNASPIFFQKHKSTMITFLQHLFYLKLITISPDNTMMIAQLKKYRWEVTRTGRERAVKKDDDCVDSLMLSVFSLIEAGYAEDLDTIEDKFATR